MAVPRAYGYRAMSSDFQVVVAGELFVDLILSGCSGWPEPGKEVFAHGFRREIGGGTAITACGLAKLGLPTAVLGMVGNEWGDWVTETLRRRDVDAGLVQTDPREPTGLTVIATMPQDRAFLTYSGANRGMNARLQEALQANVFRGIRHVHLAYAPSLETAEQIFAQLHGNGCTVSLDFGWREEWICHARAMELLQRVDLFCPNEIEAQQLTGEADWRNVLQTFDAAGVKRVALKLGSRGAALLWDGDVDFVDAFPITAVDTTGAGDCFDAGFLYGYLQGFAPDVCLRMGNICGGLSTEQYGGVAGFPSAASLNEHLRKAGCAE
jgi:sugar/nucleoside kinase (ribokinase family)